MLTNWMWTFIWEIFSVAGEEEFLEIDTELLCQFISSEYLRLNLDDCNVDHTENEDSGQLWWLFSFSGLIQSTRYSAPPWTGSTMIFQTDEGEMKYFRYSESASNLKSGPGGALDLFAEQMFISGLYLTCWSMYDCPWWPQNCWRAMSTTAQTSHWRFKLLIFSLSPILRFLWF